MAAMSGGETAVVITDMQNDICKRKGVLYHLVQEVLDEIQLVDNIAELLVGLREKGVTVIHAPLDSIDQFAAVGEEGIYGLLKTIKDSRGLRPRTWGVKMAAELYPEAGDVILQGKMGLDAFEGTNLDTTLKQKGIKTVVVVGLTAAGSVASTATTAYNKGYRVVCVEDCIGGTSRKALETTLNHTLGACSRLMSIKEFHRHICQGISAAEAGSGSEISIDGSR